MFCLCFQKNYLLIQNLSKSNLQKLYLSNNQIKKIKKYKWIDKFRSIIFTIDNNKTKKIENLDKLINLKILSLSCYKKIENLNNLINWESLS